MGIEIGIPALGIALVIGIMILRKRKIRGAISLIVFSCALIVWASAYCILRLGVQTGGPIWLGLSYLGATAAATALLAFVLKYTNNDEWLGKWGIVLLCLEPLLTQVLFWTSRWHPYFSTGYFLTKTGIALIPSPWYWINASYSDGLMILALILLTQTFLHKTTQYLLQSVMIGIGVLIPILIKIINLAINLPVPNLELPLFSFCITGALLVFAIYRFNLINITPIPRDVILETLSDGWMVVDMNDRIVDMNPAAETLLGVSREETFGQPAENIMENWPKPDQEPSVRELEIKGTLRLHGELRILSVRIMPMIRPPNRQIGKIVFWRNITERRKADNARQSARDEMFILLHSISEAAFRTLSLNDFLDETIIQIVLSFHSQAGLVFLKEGARPNGGRPKAYLASHYGISHSDLELLTSSPEFARIVANTIEKNEPFLVPDISTDPRLPPSVQQLGSSSILMLSLTTGEQEGGVICLIKDGESAFSQGEITRLGVVAEELASFIRSDRKRQKSIAQEERLSLVRDLHDSIAQKLYGVVTNTEAAQAVLENGAPVQAADLAKIGESARKAVKEMRLFLFQMKPVDLENKGLVGALTERLAAVEGRANIRARVLTDDNINLSLEKETILYYVALEALNNIIKHANNASIVTIHLKKRKASVILEVVDNGCGFDPKSTGNGGMGLRIMRERVNQVDGKVVIKSTPGKGTKVIATVSENKTPYAAKKRETHEEKTLARSR